MKLIQAMKLAKELQVKADDIRKKIMQHSAHLNIESPVYPDQKRQVREWLQSHEDITRQVGKLMVQIARTNLATEVEISLDGTLVRKTITEWIARRRLLAEKDGLAWAALTDRNLKEQNLRSAPDSPMTEIRIVRCYDPTERDKKILLYREEPGVIDRTLEVVNATTDLLD